MWLAFKESAVWKRAEKFAVNIAEGKGWNPLSFEL